MTGWASCIVVASCMSGWPSKVLGHSSAFPSSGVYICNSIVNDLRHGNSIRKSQVIYLSSAGLTEAGREWGRKCVHPPLHPIGTGRRLKYEGHRRVAGPSVTISG